MEFFRGTTLVHLKIRCWSGEKKASRDRDISMGTGGQLPPAKLLDLGRKKIFPPKALDPMCRQRKAAERVCLGSGTRFMGGYAIPDESVDELVKRLDEIKRKFDMALTDFLSDFDSNKAAWLAENQEFAHIIRDQVPDRVTVANTFEFSFKLYKLDAVKGFEPDEQDIANQVLHEIGMTCKEMSNRMLDRKTAISGKKLSEQLDPLINKLDTLSFGNGRILKVLSEFQTLKNSVPMERIDHNHSTFGQTVTFLSMCADSDKLERIVDGSFSVTKLIQGMQQQSKPSVSDRQVDVDNALAVVVPVTPSGEAGVATGAYF